MTTFPKLIIEMPEDSGKPNEPKRGRSRKRQRGSSSKTDEETNDSDMICGQHGDQVDQDDDRTGAVRFEEINQKLDKLLTLCPLIEDLKTQLAKLKEENTELKKSLQWATDEVNDLRNNQNEMRAELNNSRDMLQYVQQDLQMQTIRATLKLKLSQGEVTLNSLEYEKQKLKVTRTKQRGS